MATIPQQTRSGRRRDPSKLTYDWYINSSAWERRKTVYYARNPKRCRACGTTEDIHLHHHTYKRLGKEHDDDLIPLCHPHHDAVHKLHRSVEFAGTLTAATRHVIGGPLHPRKQKRKKRQERPQRPGAVKRGVDPINSAMDKFRQQRREPLIPFTAIIEEFGVTKKMLWQQGYHHAVPLTRVTWWRKQRPEWMKVAS